MLNRCRKHLLYGLLTFIILLSGSLAPVRADESQGTVTTLTVPEFSSTGPDTSKDTWLKQALSDWILSDLPAFSDQEIQVVERRRLRKVMEEVKFQQSGAVDQESAVKVGKQVGAQYIAIGNYQKIMDKIRLNVNIYDVEENRSVGTASQSGDYNDILKLEKLLTMKLVENLGYELSKERSELLAEVKSRNIEAIKNNYKGEKALESGDEQQAKRYFLKAASLDTSYESKLSGDEVSELSREEAAQRLQELGLSLDPDSLYKAIQNNDLQALYLFVQAGVDPNQLHHGSTPLLKAVKHGNRRIAELLLEHGADPNFSPPQFPAPLARAAQYGQKEIAKLLIESGAEVDPKGVRSHQKPLYSAITHNEPELVELFASKGVDVTQEVNNMNPLAMVLSQGKANSRRMIEVLLANGANPYKSGSQMPASPMEMAKTQGNEELVKFMRERVDSDIAKKQGDMIAINEETVDKIQKGMTLSEVKEILGEPDQKNLSSDIKTLTWNSDTNLNYINVTFVNDQVDNTQLFTF